MSESSQIQEVPNTLAKDVLQPKSVIAKDTLAIPQVSAKEVAHMEDVLDKNGGGELFTQEAAKDHSLENKSLVGETQIEQTTSPIAIINLEQTNTNNGGEEVFKMESTSQPTEEKSLTEQFSDLVARGEKTGRDVEDDLEMLEYRNTEGTLSIVNPVDINKQSLIAVKNYILALEAVNLKPETATVPLLIKALTGFEINQQAEIIEYLEEIHPLLHDMYRLPNEALMRPGSQQEHLNQLLSMIDKHNIYLKFGEVKHSDAQFLGEQVTLFDMHGQRNYRGTITIDPEKVDIKDGLAINPILAHEYVHALQDTTKIDRTGRHTNVAVMEFDAYLATIPVKSDTSWESVENIFKHILKSFQGGRCEVDQSSNPYFPKGNGPRALKS